MKRRDFLATAVMSCFAVDALAAPKKKASTTSKKAKAKPAANNTRKATSSRAHPEPARSAADSVIDSPPVGTSASRLPPVKALEPPPAAEWRTYEVDVRAQFPAGSGIRKLWLPLPMNQDTLYQRILDLSWQGNASRTALRRLPDGTLETLFGEFPEAQPGQLSFRATISTADRHFDVSRRTVPPEREDILRSNLQSSLLLPNEGLASQLGERIIGRIKDPVAQARAIFDWVTENTIYDPGMEGCGSGDVRKQLVEGRYGGRSADINGLFVSICRAIGIPARCVYGLRVGPSRLFRSLGISNEEATRAQHVRAEFYIPGYGWIPADPSDVRRAIAMELLSESDSRLSALRKVLFGIWEMNWIAYNVGSDITLPGRDTRTPFIIYPLTDRQNGPQLAAGLNLEIRSRRIEL